MFSAVLFPYVFISARGVLANSSQKLGEASRLLGAGPLRTLKCVHFPLVRPALISALFLVGMEVASDYGAAKHLGISTLTVTIFRTWFGLDDLNTARALSSLVLTAVFLILIAERWQRGSARFADRKLDPAQRIRPGKIGLLACYTFTAGPVLIGLAYPLWTLATWTAKQPDGTLLESTSSIANTFLSAGSVTAVCLVTALVLTAFARFSRKRADHALVRSAITAGYATPGTIMAVGVLSLALFARNLFPAASSVQSLLVSGSFLWLIFALSCRYLTVAGQTVNAAYSAIPTDYDRASRTLGRGPLTSFFKVHLPLLRTSLLGATALVFVDVSKELPLTLLLRPFDFETLGTHAYSMVNQGQIFASGPPSLLLILFSASALLLVELFGWKK